MRESKALPWLRIFRDWQRQSFANPTTDFSGDLRLMLNKTVGQLQFQVHHSSVLQAGDTVQWG